MAMTDIFLNKILTVFFARVKPDSRVAKPKCIINTNIVDISIQVLFTVKSAILPDSALTGPHPKINEMIINLKRIMIFPYLWLKSDAKNKKRSFLLRVNNIRCSKLILAGCKAHINHLK